MTNKRSPAYRQSLVQALNNFRDEIAVIWYTKEDADWMTGQWIANDDDFEFTDDEWDEIAGRFNDMDWQYISEVFDDLCHDVYKERTDPV